ncbi:ABC transporter, ATP-binding protein (cluster 1, maltose/g3p/polyamine/iron); ABC transporter, ATP-binding protein (cluster 10, nitrate/sulfonate/bicarbonate) [hydrothermal vent metagenome]|uniref:ABC transporter, ATP-binding protein (Cluster 1, maltose/g3p/polyamine/iron) ABC transporter, ATP-binding protein (Cluster 10, nitrate/sulfonate/bicarbonate) n=1 Tax=hydrothermal vent metagenome TaxID=652676 RepID=A0A3B0T225_9ZZZZ
MQAVELAAIEKSYGRERAVAPLDLTIDPGTFVTILGPSGCGKTTLLRLIAGLEEPDGGEIRLGENLVFSQKQGLVMPPEKRGIGLIFQSYALWPHMTVERNVTLALKEQKLASDLIESRLLHALEMVQLDDYRHRFPSELSGGQQQRVAVARLIAMRSTILLMDEPLSNLDAMLRTDMRTEMKRLHHQLEATTVYVTHDQVEALTLSDKIVVMNKGVVQQHASPFEIYHHPTNLFVAEFIGDPRINLLEGSFWQDGTGQGVDLGVAKIPMDKIPAMASGKVIAAIRPEAIKVYLEAQDGCMEASLEIAQPTGSETILFTRVGEMELTAITPGFVPMKAGRPIWLKIEAKDLNFFDPESREIIIQATV